MNVRYSITPFTIQLERTHSRRHSRRCPSTQRQATAEPRRFRRDPVGIGQPSRVTGETIDADAATSHTERTDAPPDAEPQTDAETRLQAFKAAYMALMDASRREPVKYS